jgi:Putative Ig domain/Fibronectin type III domain
VTVTGTDGYGYTATATASVVVVAAVTAPTGAVAIAGNGAVTVAWNAVSAATGYDVYDAATPGEEIDGILSVTPACSSAGAATSCTVSGLTNGTPYYFVVVASNAGGSSPDSAEMTATPATQAPPAVVTQPAEQTVAVGSTATFTALASGIPTPTVQWQVSTDGGNTFTALSDGPAISGSTTDILTVSAATAAESGNQYEAVFSIPSDPSATTDPATLTVVSPPTVTTQPADQSVDSGATATFTAAATGSTSVQWESSIDQGTAFTPLTDGNGISGSTTATLSVTGTEAEDGTQYEAVFSNTVGGVAATTTTEPATLAVIADLKVTTTSLPGATVGTGYDQTLQASGGVDPYTWKATTGQLPAGLALDASTGDISGTPKGAQVSTFTVQATDSETTAQTATAELSITVAAAAPVATAPGAPTDVEAVVGDGRATVAFTAPADNGSPITNYTVTGTPSGTTVKPASTPAAVAAVAVAGAVTASGSASPITVMGLSDGTSYTFTVTATNAAGTSPASAPSNSVTPQGPPAKPGSGYTLVGSDGGVFAFGSATFEGSLPGLGIHVDDVEGLMASTDDKGYFLVGKDGGVFSFGDAPFEGSLPGLGVNVSDIVGIVPSADDKGYFLVGKDGGVFSFGDASFEGSLPGKGVQVDDIVSIAAIPDDKGYWLLGADGTIYAFGDATPETTQAPAGSVALVADPTGGFWVVGNDGTVTPYGEAVSYSDLPSLGVTVSNIVSLVPTYDGKGYWLIGADGGVFAFGDAGSAGSLPGLGITVRNIIGAIPAS